MKQEGRIIKCEKCQKDNFYSGSDVKYDLEITPYYAWHEKYFVVCPECKNRILLAHMINFKIVYQRFGGSHDNR